MSEFKGTRGIVEVNPKASRNVRINGLTVANCSQGQSGDNEEEEKYNALMIADAFKVRQQINCELSELLGMYKECFELFIPMNKWDEATEFLSTYGSGLAKNLKQK